MDKPASLSQSVVWNLQRAYYERRASEAFAEVPHQVVDNPFIAAAYARAGSQSSAATAAASR